LNENIIFCLFNVQVLFHFFPPHVSILQVVKVRTNDYIRLWPLLGTKNEWTLSGNYSNCLFQRWQKDKELMILRLKLSFKAANSKTTSTLENLQQGKIKTTKFQKIFT